MAELLGFDGTHRNWYFCAPCSALTKLFEKTTAQTARKTEKP